jgi:phosphatidate cytidylyltransferase
MAGRGRQTSDLGSRVLVAIPAAAFAILIVTQGGLVFALGLIALGLVCLHELFTMFAHAAPSRLAGFLALVGVILAAEYGDPSTVLLATMCAVPLTFVLILLQARGGAPGVSVTLLGVVWIALPLAHAVLLRDLPHGSAIIVAILLGTFLGDTGAYLGGRAFGQRKLAPAISPNKTLEGLLCGIVVAVLVVWWDGLSNAFLGGTKGALLGLAVALAAPLGDLFESYLKRDAGTKDTGTLFGAHGGALDRLDAVLFTAVVGYYVWNAML